MKNSIFHVVFEMGYKSIIFPSEMEILLHFFFLFSFEILFMFFMDLFRHIYSRFFTYMKYDSSYVIYLNSLYLKLQNETKFKA